VQRVPRRRQQGKPAIGFVRPRAIHHAPVEHEHQRALDEKQTEAGHMKRERVQTAAQPVIHRQRRRHQRAVALVGRQRAERRRAGEEEGCCVTLRMKALF
jgi:hypothetical protein